MHIDMISSNHAHVTIAELRSDLFNARAAIEKASERLGLPLQAQGHVEAKSVKNHSVCFCICSVCFCICARNLLVWLRFGGVTSHLAGIW